MGSVVSGVGAVWAAGYGVVGFGGVLVVWESEVAGVAVAKRWTRLWIGVVGLDGSEARVSVNGWTWWTCSRTMRF